MGHHQRLGLALADGTELIARTGVDRYFRRGDRCLGVAGAAGAGL